MKSMKSLVFQIVLRKKWLKEYYFPILSVNQLNVPEYSIKVCMIKGYEYNQKKKMPSCDI